MATPPPPPPPTTTHTSLSLSPSFSSLPTTKSMDQVWNDINVTSLCDTTATTRSCVGNSSNSNCNNSNSNILLHDFLAGPSSLLDSTHQPTTLSLTFITSSANDASSLPKLTHSFLSSNNTTTATNKRVHQADLCAKLSDHLHQRIMKNRESALRSRARKQENTSLAFFLSSLFNLLAPSTSKMAYRNALEIKVARLTEENSRLKRQVEELQTGMESSAKQPKMLSLYRTSTSPF
ncbi:hypothetical protein PIB30_033437 [Stylosanthes scabra]|uniref:Uncharacterized protein n=1 Tax=Stylosanthes scabra TaxID=79078 RepID=A0ABU6TC93_9FABA|nr:hypothetical protein [Stylosanthes scabra]